MSSIKVKPDPDVALKQHFSYYLRSRIRKATGKGILEPLTSEESMKLSLIMMNVEQRRIMFQHHAYYIKVMQQTGQLPPSPVYPFPPALIETKKSSVAYKQQQRQHS